MPNVVEVWRSPKQTNRSTDTLQVNKANSTPDDAKPRHKLATTPGNPVAAVLLPFDIEDQAAFMPLFEGLT